MMSRANPVRRDRSVKPPTVKMRPSIRCFYSNDGARKMTESGPQCLTHSLDDAVLRRLVEIGVHRQADDLLRQPLADRYAAFGNREVLVGRLLVQRLLVIDRRRNPA